MAAFTPKNPKYCKERNPNSCLDWFGGGCKHLA